MIYTRTSTNKKHGFTLLFASLVGSLLLSLGIATFNIILRELDLSAAARESPHAVYAADYGWECAFYHDRKRPAVFATSTDSRAIPNPTTIRCRDMVLTVSDTRTAFSATSVFTLPLDGTACATVSIYKNDENHDKISTTVIESRGRNDCTTNPNPNRIERAIRVKY